MNKLILVNGDIATGKSHFALVLSERFNLPLFTKDEFKEHLADQSPCSTYEESHRLSIEAMDMLVEDVSHAMMHVPTMDAQGDYNESRISV